MLTNRAFELQDVQSEYDQTPVLDAERLVPLDHTKQTTEYTADEYQVASVLDSISSGVARTLSRGLTGSGKFGRAHAQMVKRLQDRKDAEAAFGQQAAQDPTVKYTVAESAGGFEVLNNANDTVVARYASEVEAQKHVLDLQGEAADLGPRTNWQTAQQRLDEKQPEPAQAADETVAPTQQAAAGEPLPPSLESEMHRDGGYREWVSFGDDSIDAWMDGIRTKTIPQDGIIASAGLRVKGTQPGMETKIPDEGHVYSIIATAAEQIEAKLATLGKSAQKVITLEETSRTANLLGENPDKLMRRMFGGNIDLSKPGALAAHMIASRDLLVSEIRILDELADFASGARPHNHSTEEVQAHWLQQAELVANLQRAYKGAQTDIARALSAFRVPVRDDPVLLQRDYADLVDRAGGGARLAGVIDGYRKEPDLSRRANQVRQLGKVARILDGAHEIWINSMLSGYRTTMKNTVGSTTQIVADVVEGYGAATMQAPKVLWGGERSVTFTDVQAKVFGEMMALREATSAAGRAFWLREAPQAGGEMTIVSGQNSLRPDAISAQNWNVSNKMGARAINIFGNLVTAGRAPMRLLQMGDAFNKTVAYRGKLWEEAYRAARLKGKKGEDLEDFIVDFLLEPPDDVAARALEHAKYATLQTDFKPGGHLKKLQSIAGSRLGRVIVPFYKTPMNSIFYVGERSPFAFFMKDRFWEPVKQGGAPRAMALSRFSAGSALMVWLATEYDAGNFTGGISSDQRIRKAYERQGIKPYHMRIGDTWWNYNLLEPFSTVIGLVGDAMEVIAHRDVDDRTAAEVWLGTAGVIGYNLQNKTFMAGLNSALEAMGNPSRYGDKLFKSFQRSMYPGSAALKDFRLLTDDLKRLRADLSDVYRAQLPGLSETLQPRLDLWGRPTEYSYFSSPYKPNKVDAELVRLRLGLTPHPMSLTKDVGLMPEEVTWLHDRAGKLAFKDLSALMNPKTKQGKIYAKLQKMSEQGDELASKKCKRAIRKTLNNAREIARRELYYVSPYAEELQEIVADINQERREKNQAAVELFEAM